MVARSEQGRRSRFHLTPRLFVAGLVTLLLVVFVATNSNSVSIHLLWWKVTAPLWLVLGFVVVLSFGAGDLLGAHRKNE